MKKNKKIALIGNSNNNFFSLTRFLKDKGYEADLFLCNNELSHFHPSNDTYSLDFMQYTFRLPFGNLYWFLDEIEMLQKNKHIMQKFSNYDVIFACGSSMAYLKAFDIKVDFFVPYGMDLVKYPFFVPSANPNHREHLDSFCAFQKQAILDCDCILSTEDIYGVKSYCEAILKIDCKNKVKTFKTFPYIYDKIYRQGVIEKFYHRSYWADEFLSFRKKSEFIIFHHARHTWKSCHGQVADKQNDKVFKAFAHLVPKIQHLNPKILTFEYGDDYLETKKLNRELGIEKYVKWLPLMARKDLMVGLHCADVATGQFFIGCAGGGVQTEALVASLPLVHYVNSEHLEDFYPFLQAREVEEIVEGLEYCANSPLGAQKIGEEAGMWLYREIESVVKAICVLVG